MKVNKGQRIQIARALLEIAAEVTAKDRRDCAEALDVSKITICYYLKGKVTNNDKALRVLEYLQFKINKRQKEIEALCKSK